MKTGYNHLKITIKLVKMNHSGMTDEEVKLIAKEGAAKLAELTGLDPRIGQAIMTVELKGSSFGLSVEQRQKLSDDNLKRIEKMAKDGACINGNHIEL